MSIRRRIYALSLSLLLCQFLPPGADARAEDVYTQGIRALVLEHNYPKAEKLIELAVQQAEDKGDFGPDYKLKLQNLAACYTHNHNLPKAEQAYRKLIVASESDKELNPNAVFGLASTYFAEGNYAAAEPLYRKALEQFSVQVGKDSPLSKGYLTGLAKCLRKLGRNSEAAGIEKKLRSIAQVQGW